MTNTSRTPEPGDDATRSTAEAARPPASGDSPKPHGDPLGAGTGAAAIVSESSHTGDSPKPHGDKLEHAVGVAAKR